MAIGAGWDRLIWQSLIESSVLSGAACFAACFIAYCGIKVLVPLIPYNVLPQDVEIHLSPAALLFSFLITIVTTTACGLAPVFHSARGDLQSKLTSSGKGLNVDFRHRKLRALLIILEISFSTILLIGTGLMMRTFIALNDVNLGFNPGNVLALRISLPEGAYDQKRENHAFYQQVLRHIRSLPGVLAAAQSISLPPYSTGGESDVTAAGNGSDKREAQLEFISEHYFDTLGIPVIRGRTISEAEVLSGRQVVVLNRGLAQSMFANRDPIGHTVKFTAFDGDPDAPHGGIFEVIGVVGDARNRGIQNTPMPEAFLPYTLFSLPGSTILIRTAVEPAMMLSRVQGEIWSVDPNVPIAQAGSLVDLLQRYTFARPKFEFAALGSFAGIGLILVVIGVFSIMAYAVSLQTRDIGVRIALGAHRNDILRMVLLNGLALIVSGLLIGLFASFGLTRFLVHEIWGISVYDPEAISIATSCVLIAGLSACVLPAYRASRADPMAALRDQ
jgi:putative ABC transport system permease protein